MGQIKVLVALVALIGGLTVTQSLSVDAASFDKKPFFDHDGVHLCEQAVGDLHWTNQLEGAIRAKKPGRVRGTNGDDIIFGTKGNDTILGLGGDDLICGAGGRDVLIGGEGRDGLVAGRGPTELLGGADKDFISGNKGNDVISGGPDNDQIAFCLGDDVVHGDDGNDAMLSFAVRSPPYCRKGPFGDNQFFGDAGNDIIRATNGNDSIDGGDGDDNISSGKGEDVVGGGAGNDHLFASNKSGEDLFDGGDGNDYILMFGGSADGGLGNDELSAKEPGAFLEGGLGKDKLYNNESGTSEGGEDNDVLAGGALLDGGPGNDRVIQGDEVIGGDGNDRLESSPLQIGGEGNDTLTGREGRYDILRGGPGNDRYIDGVADLSAAPGPISMVVEDSRFGDATFSGEGDDTMTSNHIWVIGSPFDDVFTGSDKNDIFDGGAGNDSISGGDGFDACLNGESLTECEETTGGGPLTDWRASGPAQAETFASYGGNYAVFEPELGPRFLIDDDSYDSVRIEGTTQDDALAGGYVGMVFAHEKPLPTDCPDDGSACGSCPTGFVCKLDTFILDWGGLPQESWASDVPSDEGWTLARVEGTFTLDPQRDPPEVEKYFWGHEDAPDKGYDVLATAHGSKFRRAGSQSFVVTYTPSRITVAVGGAEVLNVAGDFPPGRIGLYGYGAIGRFGPMQITRP